MKNPSGLYGRTHFDGEVIRYNSNNHVPPTFYLKMMLAAGEISKNCYKLSSSKKFQTYGVIETLVGGMPSQRVGGR